MECGLNQGVDHYCLPQEENHFKGGTGSCNDNGILLPPGTALAIVLLVSRPLRQFAKSRAI